VCAAALNGKTQFAVVGDSLLEIAHTNYNVVKGKSHRVRRVMWANVAKSLGEKRPPVNSC